MSDERDPALAMMPDGPAKEAMANRRPADVLPQGKESAMTVEIKNRWAEAVLFTAQVETVREAVEAAVKAGAYLADAYLADAYLAGAYLTGANLAGANLAGANLARANLARANLTGAKGLNPYLLNDLLMLRDQIGKIRAYKLVKNNGEGPFAGGITYEIGKSYEATYANANESEQCGAGINLSTLPWCMREWRPGYRILIAEFTAKDIAAIPIGDGKFRVHRCKIVREVDLTKIGLVT